MSWMKKLEEIKSWSGYDKAFEYITSDVYTSTSEFVQEYHKHVTEMIRQQALDEVQKKENISIDLCERYNLIEMLRINVSKMVQTMEGIKIEVGSNRLTTAIIAYNNAYREFIQTVDKLIENLKNADLL